MTAPNLVLISALQNVVTRDFYLTDPTLLQPNNANPLVDGEWLELDANYKLIRGSSEGVSPNVFPVFTERGRYDTQAIGKATVLMLGMYEAETKIYSSSGLVLGSPLTVQDVTISALTKKGLKDEGATTDRIVVGYASKILSDRVRFIHFGNVQRA